MKYVIITSFLMFLLGCSDTTADTEKQKEEIEKRILKHITKDYYDPESVRLRNTGLSTFNGRTIKIEKGFIPDMGSHTYCGEINGKNRFGAYVGYRKFAAIYVENEDGISIEVTYKEDHFYDTFSKECPQNL